MPHLKSGNILSVRPFVRLNVRAPTLLCPINNLRINKRLQILLKRYTCFFYDQYLSNSDFEDFRSKVKLAVALKTNRLLH